MSEGGHVSWISADALAQSWLPVHFAPRFLDLDKQFDARPGEFVRVGDIATVARLWPVGAEQPSWHVVRQGELLGVLAATGASDGLALLPDECVVVHPLVLRDQIATAFWSSPLMGGAGATHSTAYALVSKGADDIAWLDAALKDRSAGLQLERAAAGGLVPLVRREDLLNVRIRNLPRSERELLSRRIRQHRSASRQVSLPFETRGTLASLDIERTPPTATSQPLLTGATHEERLEQFERIMFEEAITGPGSAFFIHAVRSDERSDAFVVRPVGFSPPSTRGGVHAVAPTVADDPDASSLWRDWYWSPAQTPPFAVFNSLQGGVILPSAVTTALLEATPPSLRATMDLPTPKLPSFRDFMEAVEASRDGTVDQDHALNNLGVLWDALNPGHALSPQSFGALRHIFRPALVLRVRREGRPAGAYVLMGPDQFEEPATVAAFLEAQGQRLAAMLEQPSQIAEDAARRESLNRLSWLMHQLAGPLSRIDNVLTEVVDFVDRRPDIGDEFMPDELKARNRAEMTESPLEEFRLRSRLNRLALAVKEIRDLRYQIRLYKNAQGNHSLSAFKVADLLRDVVLAAREQRPELSVELLMDEDLLVDADREKVKAAIGEVISNALREFRSQAVAHPTLRISVERRHDRAQIAFEDNALPANASLISDPFAMDASTYSASGKGSGLGLAIVKETFASHGGRARLELNRSTDGTRRAGVTFVADLAISQNDVEKSDV